MKISLLVISFLLLVASLFGVYKAYNLPTERAVTEEVTLLDYQHQGKFDYLVYLKPSHLYGPEPQEPLPPPPDLMKYPTGIIDRFNVTFNYRFVPDRPIAGTSEEVEVRAIVKRPDVKQEPPPPPSNLKYPADMIDRFNLTFNYRFVPDRPVAGISEEVEVRAIVKRPDVKEEEIILMPRTSKTGDFTASFPLDMSDNMTGSDITISAYVYTTVETATGLIFEDFTQSLPMRSRGPLVEVEGDLDHAESGYVGGLNYEQHGEFNYEVLLKSGSPFGPITLKPPSVTPPAPLPPKTLGPGGTEEIILVPRTSKTGDFTISFPLDISDNISGSDMTISAYVYTTFETEAGPIFESFTQSLPMRARGPLVEVEGDLNHTSSGYIGELNYEQHGEFSYEVYLKPGSSFGPITLKPPSMISPTPTPPKTMNPERPIMSKLVDGMDVSFSYHLESSKPIKQLDEAVEIEAIVENPEKWSKTINLIPLTNKSGDFTITFPLDLKQFTEIFDIIQQETGVSASARNLAIKAKVHTVAETDFGTINKDFTQSIKTDLREGILAWSGNLTKSEPGSIKTTEIIRKQEKFLGLTVTQARILFAMVAGILFILFIFSLLMYFRARPAKPSQIERRAQQAQKKYKDIIVEIKELPEVKPGETVILLNSLDDLIRTAEGLLKPVLHKAEGQRHIYCVFDAATRYEHHIG